MKNNIITIDKNQILSFVEEGGKFVFKKEAEEQLLKLLEAKEMIDNAIEDVKKQIEEAGKKISPNFSGVIGEKVKAIYRVYGEKYSYQKDALELVKPYIKEYVVRKVDSKKVDEYVDENGKLPEGIEEKERSPKISLLKVEDKLLENGQ